jgi:RHS repeat-associated protein
VTEASGELAELNRYQFSTKPLERIVVLNYYGYRYYAPELGRWPSRDPIMEAGGINGFAFLNNTAKDFDYLGLYQGCTQAALNAIVNSDPLILKIKANLQHNRVNNGLKNCETPVVKCCDCDFSPFGGQPVGGYQQGNKIVICANGPEMGSDTLADSLRHEFVHAYDRCSGFTGGCRQHICSEIRAYILQNPDVNTKEQIKGRVWESVKHITGCSKDTYDADFDSQWEGCSDSTKDL